MQKPQTITEALRAAGLVDDSDRAAVREETDLVPDSDNALPPMRKVESSAIAEIAYQVHQRILFVRYKGSPGIYLYRGVSAETANELEHAESKGRFIATRIKPNHTCEKLAESPLPADVARKLLQEAGNPHQIVQILQPYQMDPRVRGVFTAAWDLKPFWHSAAMGDLADQMTADAIALATRCLDATAA